MSTGLSIFDHPFFLGFDQLEQDLDRLKKNSEGYPPYNVERIDDHHLQITLAVAGFTMNDLDVEVEHNQLTISGKQKEDKGRVFLHRGIAARQFQRSFMLADGLEVQGARLDNGLLHIDMTRIEPKSKARKIKISDNISDNAQSQTIDVKSEEG